MKTLRWTSEAWSSLLISDCSCVHHAHGIEDIEAVGIIHYRLYRVNRVHIACSSENITVLGSPQVFDERVLLQIFYTTHSISVLGKEAKS